MPNNKKKARTMQQGVTTAVLERHEWTKPSTGALKCNIATACYNELNMYCVAACVRDAHGCFVKAYTQSFEGKPEIAKALGVLEALRWIRHEQLTVFKLKRIVFKWYQLFILSLEIIFSYVIDC
jgi:hypothetical protein